MKFVGCLSRSVHSPRRCFACRPSLPLRGKEGKTFALCAPLSWKKRGRELYVVLEASPQTLSNREGIMRGRQRLFYQVAHGYDQGVQVFNGMNREVYKMYC